MTNVVIEQVLCLFIEIMKILNLNIYDLFRLMIIFMLSHQFLYLKICLFDMFLIIMYNNKISLESESNYKHKAHHTTYYIL